MKARVFLVDDEPLALRRLSRMLEATGRVDIVGQHTLPEPALAAIAATDVDLVFLDISMPEMDGFAMAKRLPSNVMVVFTTAHDGHALAAFETLALDYLVKPVRAEALARALDKLARVRGSREPAAPAPGRIASRLGDKIHFVELEHVTHFAAEDKLTYAVTAERSYIVDASLAELEERYASAGFTRIHRATLVRLADVVELHATSDGTKVRLSSGAELPVARDRVRALKQRLGLR